MKAYFLFPLIAVSIAGCAGLDITPISPGKEDAAHEGGSNIKGYIIYEPIVVVEVSQMELCSDKDAQGDCKAFTTKCSTGTPIILPDTSKPFLVNVRSGFGKAGVDITITDGWRLTGIKDTSDNTALLTTVEKILGPRFTKSIVREAAPAKCKAPGLYRVHRTDKGVELSRFLEY